MSLINIVFCLFIIFFLFLLIYLRDLFHPALLCIIIWGTILFLYFNVDHGLYKISNETVYIVILWVVFYSFFSILFSKVSFYVSPKYNFEIPKTNVLDKLYFPVIISNILLILFIIKEFGLSPTSIRRGLLGDLPLVINLLFYVNTFTYSYIAGVFLCKNNISKLKKIFLLFLLILTSFIKMNKTSFFTLFFLIILILKYNNKLKLKNIIFLLCSLIVLVFSLVAIRGDANTLSDFSIAKYLYIYILSPLTAFDFVVQSKIPVINNVGGYTFVFFNRLLSVVGLNLNTSIWGPWVNVPLPTNVFTVFAPYYIDFGIIGIIIFASIQGMFWGCIYNFQKRNLLIFKIFYSVYIYSIFLQFFSDYFFYTFSVIIQYILFSILIVCKIKEFKYFKLKVIKNV